MGTLFLHNSDLVYIWAEYMFFFITVLTFISWRTNFNLVPEVVSDVFEEKPFSSWMFFAATEEKTEKATPHRKQDARKKGQVAKSSDLNSAIVLMVIIISIYYIRGYIGLNITEFFQHMLSKEILSTLTSEQFFILYKLSLFLCFKILAPIFVIAMFFGLLSNFLQVGFVFAVEGIKPKLSNISPLSGFKKMFSKKAIFEFAKTLLKVSIIGLVIYKLVKDNFPAILHLINMDIVSTINYLENFIYQVGITAVGVFLIIAIFDFAYQKWEFSQSLKMSKYEVKKEMHQQEGDPLIKAKLREKQRSIAMRRMMQSIPEATVVVTNPTHLAIALKYDEKVMEAPQIIAKGASYLAERIKEKAGEHNIPIIEDKLVARSLYKSSEIGEYVPIELYQAVAGILAAIYSMKNRGARNGKI